MSCMLKTSADITQVEKLEKEASSNSNKIGWFLQGTL